MPKVSTFCPRCGETIETEVPDAARVEGRAEVDCPACRFAFMIAPARARTRTDGRQDAAPETERAPEPSALPTAPMAPPAGPGYAPVPMPASPRPRTMKPVTAALLLVFVVVLNLYLGAQLLTDKSSLYERFQTGEETFIRGTVRDEAGGPIANATVTVRSAPNETLEGKVFTTDANGTYRVEGGVAAGLYVLRFESAGFKTLDLELLAVAADLQDLFDLARMGDVGLSPGAGSEQRSIIDDYFEPIRLGMGWSMVGLAVVSLAGALAAYFRRSLPIAVIGAVAGMLALVDVIGAALALVALILVIVARKEFAPLLKRA